MRYLSVCSGIGSETVAWHPLGWQAAAFAEIEEQPSAVLAHHWPEIPNHGDFTTIEGQEYGPVDLLVGGTPCQSFSVAGLRKGLDDDRGNLALEFCRLADRARPRWLVWENVPGVLSISTHDAPDPCSPTIDLDGDGGPDIGAEVTETDGYEADEAHAFACFLAELSELGYHLSYRVLDAQYCRLESYPFAVPQRRKRVFVVGYLGDWRPPVAVLFEPESLRGDSPPRRKSGQSVAALTQSGVGTCGADDNQAQAGHLIPAAFGTGNTTGEIHVAGALLSHGWRGDFDSETFIAFDARQNDVLVYGDKAGPLDTVNPQQAVAISLRGRDGGGTAELCEGASPAIRASQGGGDKLHVLENMFVRRITPTEAERLMGLPDGYTAIDYKGKPMADGPRYRMLGNGIAINCLRWIGERIDLFEEVAR